MDTIKYARGTVFWAKVGDTEKPCHPVIIISDNDRNSKLNEVLAIPCSTNPVLKEYAGTVQVELGRLAYAKLYNIQPVAISRLENYIGTLSDRKLQEIAEAMKNYILGSYATPVIESENDSIILKEGVEEIMDVQEVVSETPIDVDENVNTLNSTVVDDDHILRYAELINNKISLGKSKDMKVEDLEIFLLQNAVFGAKELANMYGLTVDKARNKVRIIRQYCFNKFKNSFKTESELTKHIRNIAEEVKSLL